MDIILQQTARSDNSEPVDVHMETPVESDNTDTSWRMDSSLKTIITGQKVHVHASNKHKLIIPNFLTFIICLMPI